MKVMKQHSNKDKNKKSKQAHGGYNYDRGFDKTRNEEQQVQGETYGCVFDPKGTAGTVEDLLRD
jgi:hypothetical protein